MRSRTSWKVSLAALGLLGGLLAGCQEQAKLTDLPPHRMDLSATLPHASPPRQPASAAQPSQAGHLWVPESGYRQWKYIVIHHSATEEGCAAVFDRFHRGKGWDELGYHFVIPNGKGGPDGSVEVGSRWRCQKWGSHTGGTPDNEYNNLGIGICVVGDWSRSLPTPAQLAGLRQLVLHLARTYRIPLRNIIGHRDAPGAKTACPGDAFHKHLHGPFKADLVRDLPD